jgi:5-methyltetrahydropteroyltriglutamate--homocysteine methyltransferase
MVYAANLGYPRIGFKRELKMALEKFWSAQISEEELICITCNEQLVLLSFR